MEETLLEYKCGANEFCILMLEAVKWKNTGGKSKAVMYLTNEKVVVADNEDIWMSRHDEAGVCCATTIERGSEDRKMKLEFGENPTWSVEVRYPVGVYFYGCLQYFNEKTEGLESTVIGGVRVSELGPYWDSSTFNTMRKLFEKEGKESGVTLGDVFTKILKESLKEEEVAKANPLVTKRLVEEQGFTKKESILRDLYAFQEKMKDYPKVIYSLIETGHFDIPQLERLALFHTSPTTGECDIEAVKRDYTPLLAPDTEAEAKRLSEKYPQMKLNDLRELSKHLDEGNIESAVNKLRPYC